MSISGEIKSKQDQTMLPVWAARLPIFIGFIALGILVGGLGVWSVKTRLAGAVIASGQVQVESNRQVIQHPDGGVVGEIIAKDGDVVAAGDVLVKFDNTLLKSELIILEGQLSETRAQHARLKTERDGLGEIVFPGSLQELVSSNPDVAIQLAGQERLFAARKISIKQKIDQLHEQQSQSVHEIEGLNAQLIALNEQHKLVSIQRKKQRKLLDKGLTRSGNLSALMREEAQLKGRIGESKAGVARVRGRIAGIEIEILQLTTKQREDAISGLQKLQAREHELVQRQASLLERLSRMDVRAPVGGVIYGSKVFARRSVVQPAGPMMYVIQQDQPLIISVKVGAIDVDQISVGQSATLRFSGFDQRTTPQLIGYVNKMSADAFSDTVTGHKYYDVEILPHEGELAKLTGNNLLPGMPVEVFVKTDERTPLSYLIKPLFDYFSRSMRG